VPRPLPSHTRPRGGFTLIELLIVVVIIGILAAIGIPRFANTKGKANVAAVKSDLRNLANAQEAYFYQHSTYAPNLALLNLNQSPGVTLTLVEATATGWSASAVHPAAVPVTCAVYYGTAAAVPPATAEGTVGCQ
jgi:prepilin-type N-terminal cleavage/methylation domain-containing protein